MPKLTCGSFWGVPWAPSGGVGSSVRFHFFVDDVQGTTQILTTPRVEGSFVGSGALIS